MPPGASTGDDSVAGREDATSAATVSVPPFIAEGTGDGGTNALLRAGD